MLSIYAGPLLGHLGLCWRLSGLKFQPQQTHGSVEVEFWIGCGLMPGHLEAMLGLCWVIEGLFWAFVGSFGALLAAFGAKISTPTDAWLRWGWILDRFRAYAGPFGGYVGPLLGHLGLCWRLSGLKFQPQRMHGSVEVEFWIGCGLRAIWRLCWAFVGSLKDYVGPLSGHLGLCWRLSG